jgi:hypothetical protein
MRTDDFWSVEEALDRQLGEQAVPRASSNFRHRAWREFQRAIDPLARPRPRPPPRQQ